MTNEEIQKLKQSAKNSNLDAEIAKFLGCEIEYRDAGGVPAGFEAAFGGIRWEVEAAGDEPKKNRQRNRWPFLEGNQPRKMYDP